MEEIAVYPAFLPLPTYRGYGIIPTDLIQRTEMESGPARQRRRFTQAPTVFSVQWNFSASQFGIFEGWYRFKAREGASFFRIKLQSALGLSEHLVRFQKQGAGPYSAKISPNNRVHITAVLEAREVPRLSEDSLDLALSLPDFDVLESAILRMHIFTHTTLPARPGWTD